MRECDSRLLHEDGEREPQHVVFDNTAAQSAHQHPTATAANSATKATKATMNSTTTSTASAPRQKTKSATARTLPAKKTKKTTTNSSEPSTAIVTPNPTAPQHSLTQQDQDLCDGFLQEAEQVRSYWRTIAQPRKLLEKSFIGQQIHGYAAVVDCHNNGELTRGMYTDLKLLGLRVTHLHSSRQGGETCGYVAVRAIAELHAMQLQSCLKPKTQIKFASNLRNQPATTNTNTSPTLSPALGTQHAIDLSLVSFVHSISRIVPVGIFSQIALVLRAVSLVDGNLPK